MLAFDRLQTPPNDGDVLIEPSARSWRALINRNIQERNRSPFELAGRSSTKIIPRLRQALYGSQHADRIVIACGHQPAFVHPGVWAKHVVVHHVADSLGVLGADFVVDQDAPTPFSMTVPVTDADELYRLESIPIVDGAAGAAYEGQPPLTADQIDRLENKVRSVLADTYDRSMLPAYYEGHRSVTDAYDIVHQHLISRARVDTQLSADLMAIRMSRAFGGPFLADLLIHADRFAQAYNEALHAYRRQHQIRNPRRPLPNLAYGNARVETALWTYQPRRRRRRLLVERNGVRLSLFADTKLIGDIAIADLTDNADAALAALDPWVIRPRALTLTLWARLLACDLFVHGIGGAKYDRITDGIIKRYYRRQPPAFACVSATLRLPLPVCPVEPRALPAARQQLRDVRYNPDRFLLHPPAELMARRSKLIRESDRLRKTRGPREARRETFLSIRRVNARLLEHQPELQQELSGRITRIERELAANAVACSREHFYLLQPQDRLDTLAKRLRQVADLPA